MENTTKQEDIYEPKVQVKSESILSGTTEYTENISNSNIPLLKAFWEDVDIREITITSTNIGFIKTYRKQYN